MNVLDDLASAAHVVMGEGRESAPLALITDTPFVRFDRRAPQASELRSFLMNLKEDAFGAILNRVPWRRGGASPLPRVSAQPPVQQRGE